MKNNLKYILKNSWDILPGINGFQLFKSANQLANSLLSKEIKEPSYFKVLGRIGLTSIYGTFGLLSLMNGSLNPGEWQRQAEKRYNQIQEQIQYEHKIDSTYQIIFQEAKNVEDSLRIARENDISYKLILKPLFKDKERIANSLNQNK